MRERERERVCVCACVCVCVCVWCCSNFNKNLKRKPAPSVLSRKCKAPPSFPRDGESLELNKFTEKKCKTLNSEERGESGNRLGVERERERELTARDNHGVF